MPKECRECNQTADHLSSCQTSAEVHELQQEEAGNPAYQQNIPGVYRVVCSWKVVGEFDVEASSPEEAREKVYDIPTEKAKGVEYVDDTFEVVEAEFANR